MNAAGMSHDGSAALFKRDIKQLDDASYDQAGAEYEAPPIGLQA